MKNSLTIILTLGLCLIFGTQAEAMKPQDKAYEQKMIQGRHECELWVDAKKTREFIYPKGIKGGSVSDKVCKNSMLKDENYLFYGTFYTKNNPYTNAPTKKYYYSSEMTYYNGGMIKDLKYNGQRIAKLYTYAKGQPSYMKKYEGKSFVYTVRIKNPQYMKPIGFVAKKYTDKVRNGENSIRTARPKATDITVVNRNKVDGDDYVQVKNVKKGYNVKVYGTTGTRLAEKVATKTGTMNVYLNHKQFNNETPKLSVTVESPSNKYMESHRVFKAVPKEKAQARTKFTMEYYPDITNIDGVYGMVITNMDKGVNYAIYIDGKKQGVTNKVQTSNYRQYMFIPITDKAIVEGIKTNLANMHKNHKIEVTMQKNGLAESEKKDITLGFLTWDYLYREW